MRSGLLNTSVSQNAGQLPKLLVNHIGCWRNPLPERLLSAFILYYPELGILLNTLAFCDVKESTKLFTMRAYLEVRGDSEKCVCSHWCALRETFLLTSRDCVTGVVGDPEACVWCGWGIGPHCFFP